MNRLTVIEEIQNIAHDDSSFERLEGFVNHNTNTHNIGAQLLHCGVIPEQFTPSSSEEKLWAKYCDILLSFAFNLLGMQANVIRVRGNSADVHGEAEDYTIVADAKAFRLSRTAKNQKDFKINALNDWRRKDTFACLVAPLYQYPKRTSQIYKQAKQRNVTVLGYVHLKFLLDFSPATSLKSLWEVPKTLPINNEAFVYWSAIEAMLLTITGKAETVLDNYKSNSLQIIQELGDEGLTYWHGVIKTYHQLSQEEAINRLIQAEKIDQKITTIQAIMRIQ